MRQAKPYVLLVASTLVALTTTSAEATNDDISGKFYRFKVVGRAGLGQVTDVPPFGPSINDSGQIVFTGQVSPTARALFVSNLTTAAPVLINQGNLLSFAGGIKINDNGHFVAMDVSTSVDAQGFRQNFLRSYDAATPGTGTIVAGASNPIANDFRQIYFPAAINGSDLIVFSGLRRTGPTTNTTALITGTRPSFTFADLAVSPIGLNPMIATNGDVVVRAGLAPSSPIRLYNYSLTVPTDIASSATGFTVLGASPDISDNGDVIVFYGERGPADKGIWASIRVGGSRQLVKVAGREVESLGGGGDEDGVCDATETACEPGELGFDPANAPRFFASFEPNSRVGVTHMPLGATGIAGDTFVVSFIGTPNAADGDPALFSAARGLWTVRVDIAQVGATIVEKPFVPQPVIQVGDRIGNRTVLDVRVYDPLAAAPTDDNGAARAQQQRGDHRVAFWASTDMGSRRSRHPSGLRRGRPA